MRKISNLILIIVVLSLTLPLSAFAIGQMVKPIVIENAVRGEEYEATLMILNSEEEEILFDLLAEGAIAQWVSFYSVDDKINAITNIEIPAKANRNAIVRFTIPGDAPNDVYFGNVSILTVPETSEETGKTTVSVTQKIPRRVKITVGGEEKKSCKCYIIPEDLKLGKDDSLKFNIQCHNNGNVRIEPSIQQKITKDGETIFGPIVYLFPEEKGYIRPNSLEKWFVEWPTLGQENGIYKIEMKVLLDSEIHQEKIFHFQIGNDISKFLAGIGILGGGNLTLAWFIIGIILLSITGILIFINKKQINFKKINFKKCWKLKL